MAKWNKKKEEHDMRLQIKIKKNSEPIGTKLKKNHNRVKNNDK